MDKFKHGTMVWNDISCSHLYNYLHGNPEYLLYYCTWKHGLLELLLPIHNTLCAVYMYYTMNVYNYNNLSCYCQWADGADHKTIRTVVFLFLLHTIFHTNHNINFSYFRLHLSMHQWQVKKASPAHNGNCPRKINTGHNKGIWTPALTKKQLSLVGIANRCFPNQNIFKESKISESSFHFFSSECYVWPLELII